MSTLEQQARDDAEKMPIPLSVVERICADIGPAESEGDFLMKFANRVAEVERMEIYNLLNTVAEGGCSSIK